ncbi:MAG: hypothetical protein LZF60_270076 [Nitrospira sp.]|nr:MAG: hypothetical protein LZF60_270076 [Nitrospira sp.]
MGPGRARITASRRHHRKTGLDVSVKPTQLQAKSPRKWAEQVRMPWSIATRECRVAAAASVGVES